MLILPRKVTTYFCLSIIMMINGIELSIAQDKNVGNNTLAKYVIGSGGVINSSSQIYFHSATGGEVIVGGIGSTKHFMNSGFWRTPYLELVEVDFKTHATIPRKYQLYQNYPNPFNPTTTIEYDIPELSTVNIEIFNSTGQRVRYLIRAKTEEPGNKKVSWDGRNDSGNLVASGAHFCRVYIRNQKQKVKKDENMFQQTMKMLFLK